MPKAPIKEPTFCQMRAYNFVKQFIQMHGYPPTVREIQKGLEFKSPAPASSLLNALRRKGLITWRNGDSRTIQLVGYKVQLVPTEG